MELLAGEDLEQRLKREGRLDPGVALGFGLQAARALGAAHAAGVIHRDLKPANLFLCARDDGSIKVKLLDFGISKILRGSENDGPQVLTRQGSVVGTPQYMSPEQAQGLAVDARTDVWSLGAVLFEAIAGRPVFPVKPTYEQTIIQVVTQPPPRLEDQVPGVPPEVARVVHEALQPFLEERLPDGAALARRLVEIGVGGGVDASVAATLSASRPSSVVPSRPSRPMTGEGLTVEKAAKRRLPLGLVLAAVTGVLLAGALALVLAMVVRPPAPQAGFALAPTAPATVPPSPALPPVPVVPDASAPAAPPPGGPSADAPSTPASASTATHAHPHPRPPGVPKPPSTHAPSGGGGQIGGAGTTNEY